MSIIKNDTKIEKVIMKYRSISYIEDRGVY